MSKIETTKNPSQNEKHHKSTANDNYEEVDIYLACKFTNALISQKITAVLPKIMN